MSAALSSTTRGLKEAAVTRQRGGVVPGLRFARLTVLKKAEHQKEPKNTYWECLCDCGKIIIRPTGALRNGSARSCGCLTKELPRKLRRTIHNGNPREYRIWYFMVQRCHNPNNRHFVDYGGRGIAVCEEWRNSFHAFLRDMGRSEGREIDRIENNAGYSPDNCRWTDDITQCNNRRSNVFFEHDGLRLTIAQWARRTGIKEPTFRRRVREGNTPTEIFSLFDLHHNRPGRRVGSVHE